MQYDTDADCGDALTERVGCQNNCRRCGRCSHAACSVMLHVIKRANNGHAFPRCCWHRQAKSLVTTVKSNNIRPCKLIRPFWQVAALISGAPFMHAVCSQLGNFPIQQSRGGHTFYMQLWHLSNAADTHTGCLPSQRGRLECRWQRWSPGDHCHNCCWDEPALPEISKHHS